MLNNSLIHTAYDAFDWFFSNEEPKEVLNPAMDWSAYLPKDEIQDANSYDPMSCTSFGSLNAIEALMKRKFNIDVDYSERALAIASGTSPQNGNDPHNVLQAIRHLGLIDEDLLPLSIAKTIEEYYVPNPLTDDFIALGKKWLSTYMFNHYWVFRPLHSVENKILLIKDALRYSPVCVSVHAWSNKDGIYYKPEGSTDNHWTVLYGFDENGNWKIFDSLSNSHKLLIPTYDFTYAKMFSISLNKKTWIERLFAILTKKK